MEPNQAGSACSYSDFLDIMRGLPLFAGAPLDVCKVLAYLCQPESFNPGDWLVKQGEHAESFHYLVCGRVEAVRETGGGTVTVKTMAAGESFGGLSLILGGVSLYGARALEQAEVMTLSREKYLKTVRRFPQLEPAVLQALAGHVLAWEQRFLERRPAEFADMGGEFGLTLF
jgi:CRP-like cAMP-binding protein